MGLVTFDDREGNRWRAWKVETPAERAHLMDSRYRTGWLVFEREDEQERRRLSHVPDNWATLPPERLDALRESAAVVTPTPRTGITLQSRVEIERTST